MSRKLERIGQFAAKLSVVLLSGPWTADALRQRCRAAFHPKKQIPWVAELSDELMAAFPEAPGLREVERITGANTALADWLRRQSKSKLPRVSLAQLPTVMLPAVAVMRSWNLPTLTSFGQLAEWLDVTPDELDWLADPYSWERCRTQEGSRNYRYRWLRRAGKSPRLLESPKLRLRQIQRQILRELLNRVPAHQAAHGFRQGRSIASFAAPHVNREFVCRLDLQHFFAQIRRPRVKALFSTLGYPMPVAHALSALCTNAVPGDILKDIRTETSLDRQLELQQALTTPHLPQGAPTSPALANLVAFPLDRRLSGLLAQAKGNYTRYADDLVFSGDRKFALGWPRLKLMILAITLDEGFPIRARKTREMFHSQRQQVAGLILNEALHLPRNEYDALKACLFNCTRFGPTSQNHAGHPDFQAHLAGRISYLRQYQPERAAKFQRLMDRIDWTK